MSLKTTPGSGKSGTSLTSAINSPTLITPGYARRHPASWPATAARRRRLLPPPGALARPGWGAPRVLRGGERLRGSDDVVATARLGGAASHRPLHLALLECDQDRGGDEEGAVGAGQHADEQGD